MTDRGGRPPVTTRAELEQVALELFATRGFDETTVEDIAAEAGISRRTFFRYHGSKNDVVWGEFDALMADMDTWLGRADPGRPMLEVLTEAVVRFNAVPPEAAAAHRDRMALILRVPALQAHSTLRYAEWRRIVAEFAARRLDAEPNAFGPQLLAHLALGAAVASYDMWLADDSRDLEGRLRAAFSVLPDEGTIAPAT